MVVVIFVKIVGVEDLVVVEDVGGGGESMGRRADSVHLSVGGGDEGVGRGADVTHLSVVVGVGVWCSHCWSSVCRRCWCCGEIGSYVCLKLGRLAWLLLGSRRFILFCFLFILPSTCLVLQVFSVLVMVCHELYVRFFHLRPFCVVHVLRVGLHFRL